MRAAGQLHLPPPAKAQFDVYADSMTTAIAGTLASPDSARPPLPVTADSLSLSAPADSQHAEMRSALQRPDR